MTLVVWVLTLVVIVGVLIDILTRDDSQVKHLPKVVWILLVVVIPLVGILLWFWFGRERGAARTRRQPNGSGASGSPRPARPAARPSVPARPTPPAPAASWAGPAAGVRSTEEQLADLDREIEYYRKLADLEQRKREAEGGASAG